LLSAFAHGGHVIRDGAFGFSWWKAGGQRACSSPRSACHEIRRENALAVAHSCLTHHRSVDLAGQSHQSRPVNGPARCLGSYSDRHRLPRLARKCCTAKTTLFAWGYAARGMISSSPGHPPPQNRALLPTTRHPRPNWNLPKGLVRKTRRLPRKAGARTHATGRADGTTLSFCAAYLIPEAATPGNLRERDAPEAVLAARHTLHRQSTAHRSATRGEGWARTVTLSPRGLLVFF